VPQMIAATIIARNPQKFGFGKVPYQPPLTPATTPNLAVAQVATPAAAITPPQPRHKPPAVHLASKSEPQPRTASNFREKPKAHARRLPKTASRRLCAVDHKHHGKHTSHARSSPYVASLFGYPHSHSRKTATHGKKSISSGKARRGSKPEKIRRSPTLLAHKHRSKPVHLAKKKSRHKAKLSRTKRKTKAKAFLVSQAR
jgi:hypothetical protein